MLVSAVNEHQDQDKDGSIEFMLEIFTSDIVYEKRLGFHAVLFGF
jgi:hypothetical protein